MTSCLLKMRIRCFNRHFYVKRQLSVFHRKRTPLFIGSSRQNSNSVRFCSLPSGNASGCIFFCDTSFWGRFRYLCFIVSDFLPAVHVFFILSFSSKQFITSGCDRSPASRSLPPHPVIQSKRIFQIRFTACS